MAPFSKKYIPSLPFLNFRHETSTPCDRSSLMHSLPIGLSGKILIKRAGMPNLERATATFASLPPKVASKKGDCSNLSCPGDFNLSIISPNVAMLIPILLPIQQDEFEHVILEYPRSPQVNPVYFRSRNQE